MLVVAAAVLLEDHLQDDLEVDLEVLVIKVEVTLVVIVLQTLEVQAILAATMELEVTPTLVLVDCSEEIDKITIVKVEVISTLAIQSKWFKCL